MEKLIPKMATTMSKVCELKKDNVSTRKSWLLINSRSRLTICNQIKGGNKSGMITISFKEFERFIKFYETGK